MDESKRNFSFHLTCRRNAIWGKMKTDLLSSLSNSTKVELQPCNFLTHLNRKSEMSVVRTKMFYLHFWSLLWALQSCYKAWQYSQSLLESHLYWQDKLQFTCA